MTCFLFANLAWAQAEDNSRKVKHLPKEMTREELIKALDCMLNRVLLVTRFNDPVTKEWAADGVLRVKYVITYDLYYPSGNLFVLVLKKKSSSYGYVVFYDGEP